MSTQLKKWMLHTAHHKLLSYSDEIEKENMLNDPIKIDPNFQKTALPDVYICAQHREMCHIIKCLHNSLSCVSYLITTKEKIRKVKMKIINELLSKLSVHILECVLPSSSTVISDIVRSNLINHKKIITELYKFN